MNKPNTGALFKNKDKKTEKSPDYSGSLDVGSIEYKLAGWLKESKAGTKYISLAIKGAENKPTIRKEVSGWDELQEEANKVISQKEIMDDQIPF